jgi:hypothetical protein
MRQLKPVRPSPLTKPDRESERLIVTINRTSAPRLFFSGEDLVLCDLPVGTRVIYPQPPIAGVPNPRAAVRWAINHPEGMDPLHALLRPGMKVSVAVDDISVILPPMQKPDVRQIVLEVVLQLLADSGVDDVHIIIANSLHRRMTEAEMRRMVGDKIFNAFYPKRYYNHDAEDPDGIVELSRTAHGEVVAVNRRAAESDLLIYVNVNLVPMDGGHKSVGVGLANYRSLRAHHTPQTIRKTETYMDPGHSALHRSTDRIGRVIDKELKVFHIETCINNRMFDGPMQFLSKNEDEYGELERLQLGALTQTLKRLPRIAKRKIFQQVPAAYQLTGCFAGATEPCHTRTLELCYRQYAVPVEGQADIVVFGLTPFSPYSVNSSLNPLLVQCMALGYYFNLHRGRPLVKKGGTIIFTHPCPDEFDPEQHAPYIEFFHRLLPETRDALVLEQKYEEEFAQNPSYIHLYRKGNAYHGAHPFYMWYWGENGRQHVGQVIAVGTENSHVPEMLGFEHAQTLDEAIDLARGRQGRNASITVFHCPPILLTDVS